MQRNIINQGNVSLRKRVFGFLGFHFFFYLVLLVLSLPMLVSGFMLAALGVSENYSRPILIGIEICFVLLLLWKLAEEGMTIRHIIAGYAIRTKEGKILNPLLLYLRELFTYVTCFYTLIKIVTKPLIMRSLNYSNDEKYFVKVQDGKIYTSEKSVGELQFNSDIKKSSSKFFDDINNNGLLHDNLFSTYALEKSRLSVIESLFKSKKNNKMAAIQTQESA